MVGLAAGLEAQELVVDGWGRQKKAYGMLAESAVCFIYLVRRLCWLRRFPLVLTPELGLGK